MQNDTTFQVGQKVLARMSGYVGMAAHRPTYKLATVDSIEYWPDGRIRRCMVRVGKSGKLRQRVPQELRTL